MARFAALCLVCLLLGSAFLCAAEPLPQWLGQLRSKEPVEHRRAQIELARTGAAALADLEKLAEKASPLLQKRIRATISLMLLKSIPPTALEKYPRLTALGNNQIKQARKVAMPFYGAKSYDTGERGLAPPGAPVPPPSAARQAVEKLAGYQGWAVPVAIELCEGKTAASRLYGAEILRRVEAIAQIERLKKLGMDPAPISLFFGDYTDRTTVGKTVSQALKSSSVFRRFVLKDIKYPIGFEVEEYLRSLILIVEKPLKPSYQLINELRQKGRTYQAISWDDFWKRAIPVLKEKWKE